MSTTRLNLFKSLTTRSISRSRQAGNRSRAIRGYRPFCRPGGRCFPVPSSSTFSAKSKLKGPDGAGVYRGSPLPAPSCRVEPGVVGRKSFACKQGHGFVERQADHIGILAHELDDECAGQPLSRIAPRLAAPLAGAEIGVDVLGRQSLE